ncbi:MAG: PQQ-binding-like beta-propeller repeat protein [Phenylobacterium sp.]|uniref:outer membrane protein assembly factor BamB family protein n=1 Tax=Phenylobacterium sp. TaxID=1871053 RepID=UPI001A5B82AB|nr:PQQ-binding-like beta-propeller repeat protein [Phenylobacterium sp.]MBL8554558.1 PQQ-binding-like beta-propeller repeat protein [Phenylobacterium sp.]
MRGAKAAAVALAMAASGCSERGGDPRDTDWALLGNGPSMQHHADLKQIDKASVSRLGLAWAVEMPTAYGLVGNPLIEDGVVYQGGPGGRIFANDLKTGKLLWQFAATYPEDAAERQSFGVFWARQFNRGMALYRDKAIIATGDCRLVAVDRKSGVQRWAAQSCDPGLDYGIAGAPRVGGGLVFIGNSNQELGTQRGFVDAFDAETGKRRWRFYTVPGDPKTETDPFYRKIAETWGTGWYGKTHGAGAPWDALTYDEKLGQLIIGTGALGPGEPSARAADAGDELFTNSVVAVDAKTGKYRWHAKQVPHDGWNYEAAVGLMVADVPVGGTPRHVVVSVPKQGFAYVYDAASGKFLAGTQYVDVAWAKGLDADGRPIFNPEAQYWNRPGQDTLVLPGGMGAHGWEALAFDPRTSVLYVPTMILPVSRTADGAYDWLYGDRPDAKVKPSGQVVAIDLAAGRVKWRTTTSRLPVNGGLLHTAGGLVFQGLADGRLLAFDAATGAVVWGRQTGGAIRAAPSSVMLDGEQYIVVATGNGAASASASLVSRYASTPQARTPPRLLAFKLGGSAAYPPLAKADPVPTPPGPRQSPTLAKQGETLFAAYQCEYCHGTDGGASVGGGIPNLNRTRVDLAAFKGVVQGGDRRSGGMPQFRDMPDAHAAALYAYVLDAAWDAHEGKAGRSVSLRPR